MQGVIDRIECGIAVIETADGMKKMSLSRLPANAREGSHIIFDDSVIILDSQSELSFMKEIEKLNAKIFKR